MQDEIVNRVASSKLITFDLEQFHQEGSRVLIDIKDQLYNGLILREKEFRDYIKLHDWPQYKDFFVAISCTVDAIIPTWAYMLISIALQPHAKRVVYGDLEHLEQILFLESLGQVNWNQYQGAKVVVKGCSKIAVPVDAYVEAASQLRAVGASIMYGEPCSTVPLYKPSKS